jgi:hypothetical protein
MLGWLMSGRQGSDCARRIAGPIRCANQGVPHLQADRKPAAVQILLTHTKIERIVGYLGVDVEDALAFAEGAEE